MAFVTRFLHFCGRWRKNTLQLRQGFRLRAYGRYAEAGGKGRMELRPYF